MKSLRLAALIVALATPAWAIDPLEETRTRYLAIELCQKMGGTGAICVMKHSPEDFAVRVAVMTLKECDASDAAVRLGIKPNASWLAEHPGWTSENEAKVCAADRADIKQRWGY